MPSKNRNFTDLSLGSYMVSNQQERVGAALWRDEEEELQYVPLLDVQHPYISLSLVKSCQKSD